MSEYSLKNLYIAYESKLKLNLRGFQADTALVKDVQTRLQQFNLLEKVDGDFGIKSQKALNIFSTLRQENETGFTITPAILKSLIEKSKNNWVDDYYFTDNIPNCNGIVQLFLMNNWTLNTKPGEINLCSLRGLNRNGSINGDNSFKYNDRFIIFQFEEYQNRKKPVILHNWLSTSQPGKYYWDNPLNSNGCAVLKENQQFKAWSVGIHRNYRALVQTGKVNVIRGSKKFSDSGYFGINIHSVGRGEDFNFNDDIGKYSAGCTVLASRAEFDNQFMPAIYSSKQYKTNKLTQFEYVVIDNFRESIPYLRPFQF